MGKNPWMKFYATDWRADPKLRMCSLAARGLWMECLCIMHEATPYGHLLVEGCAPTNDQLAVLAGTPSAQLPDLIRELENVGVFSRTGKGIIYSRRMTRDEKKSKTAAKNGKKGGNPSICKQTENPALLNPMDKPQKPEARSQKNIIDDQFEEFWSVCLRKVGKGQARKAYATALKKTSHEEIMAGMRRYAEAKRDTETEFIAHPATWLNGERWADEDAKPKRRKI